MVTIYDIAKEAQTSAVTVSLALRNSGQVATGTRERIHSIAKKVGYRPNPMARGLAGAKTQTIAFVFNFSSEDLAYDLSYMEYFHAIAQAASAKKYKIYFHSSTAALPVEDILKDMAHHGVDGMVLGSNFTDADYEALRNSDIPTIVLGRNFEAEKVTCVSTDDRDGIRQTTEHLLELGHERIAFVGKSDHDTAVARYEGFIATMLKAGISVAPELIVESRYDMDSGERAGEKLAELDMLPTAVVAATDQLAIGIIAGLKTGGLRVPDDISVTGYDNLHISRFTVPALTTVDLLRTESGVTVVDALLNLISGKQNGETIHTPVKLVVRDSTGKVKK